MKRYINILLAVTAALVTVGCTAKSSSSPAASAAKGYPGNAITIVVPFNAGSNTDRQIRFLQPYLEKALGVNTVVINNGGASGTIGVTDFLTQNPDGYTILFTLPTPTVYKPTAGDTKYKVEDLIPVARVTTAAMYLAVSEKSKFASGADVIEFIKQHPGEFTYANAGNGGIAHLAFASFLEGEELSALSIPFTGGTAEGYTAVMGNHVMSYIPGEQDLVGRTDIRAIINLGTKSAHEGFSNVQTLAELGYEGYEINNFSGFYFMKGVDPAIVDAFDKAVAAVLSSEDFKAAAKASNFNHNYASSSGFSAQIQSTVKRITPVFAKISK